MQLENNMLSTREPYAVGLFESFLWWLAAADKNLLIDCKIDRSRYAIIGMSVLGTWVFATLAWMYFFSTVVNNTLAFTALGLLMGGIILSIDRLLIKGMNKMNKKQLLPFLLRASLAVIIGTFMAQPALLYLFNKEVQVQISIDNEQRKLQKQKQQDTVFFKQKKELLQNKQNIQTLLQQRYAEVANARNNFIAEADGSGGTKKVGMQAIAKAKQQEYEKLQVAYNELQFEQNIVLKNIDSLFASINFSIKTEQEKFNDLLNDGFLTRIEALNHLIGSNTALRFRYYLLIAILLLIELMPVMAKLLLPIGTYDEKIVALEAIEKQIVASNIQNEIELKQLHQQLAFKMDVNLLQSFFTDSEKGAAHKLKSKIQEWETNSSQSFVSFKNQVQKDIFNEQ